VCDDFILIHGARASNILSSVPARADKDTILWGVDEMLERPLEWDKPFGEGKATQKTVEALHAHT